ncbi:MAG TPA: alkaline phosphatase [Actinomycetota bacterium]|nr:alkaline phosphatase [Actinomycetota bacterium]
MRSRTLSLACGVLAALLLALVPVSSVGAAVQPGCAGTPATLPPDQQPRNVILMIGDGMGPESVELGRLFAGALEMEALDEGAPGSATTQDISGGTTDSAASATALATGCKTYDGAISVDVNGAELGTAWERAHGLGKASGILSSVFLADATPGVWAAHADSRYNYTEIATEQARSGVEVLLGAGAQYYRPQGAYGTGGPNLINEMRDAGYDYVRKASELAKADGPKLLGFFGGATMTYALDRPLSPTLTEPTLAQMTDKALELLSTDAEGFFLVVEGGAIDWLAHKKDAAGVMHDVAAFDDAIAVARAFAEADGETLLVVTADHETGGLQVGADVDLPFLRGIRATTDIIWSAIEGGMTVEKAMRTYGGITNLSASERRTISSCASDLGIADVLSARGGVRWGWGSCEGAHHTDTPVPVFATGPGAASFDGDLDNAVIGQLILDAVA